MKKIQQKIDLLLMAASKPLLNNHGFELLQLLIIALVAIVLGAILKDEITLMFTSVISTITEKTKAIIG